MSFHEIMDTQLFDADAHTKGESLSHLVTTAKVMEMYLRYYWE